MASSSSQIQICNRALQKLGVSIPIVNFSDNTASARAMNIAFVPVVEAELRRRRWKFSILRTQLAQLAGQPATGIYTNMFQLPADNLRILEIGDWWPGQDISDYRGRTTAEFQVENNIVLTNYPAPLSLRYVSRIMNTGQWDSAFAEAISARLAWETCEQITQSPDKRKLAMAEYKTAIGEAIRANALESGPEFNADDSWVTSRIA
jgi:hypothetical protein